MGIARESLTSWRSTGVRVNGAQINEADEAALSHEDQAEHRYS